jgi:hypothetical protein
MARYHCGILLRRAYMSIERPSLILHLHKCIVFSPGKFLLFLSLLYISFCFAGCSNPSGSDRDPVPPPDLEPSVYTVTFIRNYDRTDITALYFITVTAPATTIGTGDFPANPSRDGYLFSGWNTASDGSGSSFTASTAVSGNINDLCPVDGRAGSRFVCRYLQAE